MILFTLATQETCPDAYERRHVLNHPDHANFETAEDGKLIVIG